MQIGFDASLEHSPIHSYIHTLMNAKKQFSVINSAMHAFGKWEKPENLKETYMDTEKL